MLNSKKKALKSKPASSTDERKIAAIPVEDESEGLIYEETRTTYPIPIGANLIELLTDKYGFIRIELLIFLWKLSLVPIHLLFLGSVNPVSQTFFTFKSCPPVTINYEYRNAKKE